MSRVLLRLYVTGTTPTSQRAVEHVREICRTEACDLEICDVLESPEQAETDRIIATPALVRKSPLPERKLVGDLSQGDRVLAALDLPSK